MECHTLSVKHGEARYNKNIINGDTMITKNKEQHIKAELRYLGRPCWKTSGFNTIHTGVIREVRLEAGWVEADVYWQMKNGEQLTGKPHSWERVNNLGFEPLPSFNTRSRADLPVDIPSNELTPWSGRVVWEDCEGLNEDDPVKQLTLEFEPEDQTENKGEQSAVTHPHRRAPKRDDQPVEANRQINYRALLALIDGRERDDWHALQLNESLKREGCNTITPQAFEMRANKFQKSFERSLLAGNTYRIEEFLNLAFNGEYHGPVGKGSIWSRF